MPCLGPAFEDPEGWWFKVKRDIRHKYEYNTVGYKSEKVYMCGHSKPEANQARASKMSVVVYGDIVRDGAALVALALFS